MKEADEIHLTDEAIIFFVCRVNMMVALIRMGCGVVLCRKGIVQFLDRGGIEKHPQQKEYGHAFCYLSQLHRFKVIQK